MKYNDLFNDFIKYCKFNYSDVEEYIKDSKVDNQDGLHIWFSFVVCPLIKKLMKQNDDFSLNLAFDYFEMMLETCDSDITEVVEVTVLENLLTDDDPFIIETTKKYMRNKTKEAAKYLKLFFDIDLK